MHFQVTNPDQNKNWGRSNIKSNKENQDAKTARWIILDWVAFWKMSNIFSPKKFQ